MNLVTGATGLLGSHIVEQLVKQGHPVRALVREGSDTKFLESLNSVELAYGDIVDPESLEKAMVDIQTVYHSAAAVGDWGNWESYFVPVTIGGTRNMIAAATSAGVKRFLFVSSISAYGHPNPKGVVFDETAPLGSKLHKWSYYSRAKIEAEKLVWEAHNKGDIKATVVKPSWLYGPRDRASMPRLVSAISRGKGKLIGDGSNLLNLTHAANCAEGCILAATMDCAVGENYNLSSDGRITQAEYLNAIARHIDAPAITKKVPYAIVKQAAFWMEFFGHLFRRKTQPLVTRYSAWIIGRSCFFTEQKAREQLGWKATIGYEEGIADAVKWCRENVS